MVRPLTRAAGRTSFGRNAARYDAARPAYPARIFDLLERRCGLGPGARVLEIGPGTGIATRELLRRGVERLTAVEADPRMARFLLRSLGDDRRRVELVPALFERAELPRAGFDLAVCATAFHWLNERRALAKVARLLRPGGWWAAWWNSFGDPARPTRFQRAIDPLYADVPTRTSERSRAVPSQLDRPARERALRQGGHFRRISSTVLSWDLELETPRLVALYSTHSEIASLPPARRRAFLAELGRIADERFRGRVKIRMRTPIYTAERI